LVDGIIARMQEELADSPWVMATGGLAGPIAAQSRFIKEVVPDLTLEGLRIIFTRIKTDKEQDVS